MCQIILGCDGSRFENTELLRPKPLQLSILHCMSRTLYVVSAFYFQGTWRSIDVCCNERGVRVWKEGLCRDLPFRALSSLLPRDAVSRNASDVFPAYSEVGVKKNVRNVPGLLVRGLPCLGPCVGLFVVSVCYLQQACPDIAVLCVVLPCGGRLQCCLHFCL